METNDSATDLAEVARWLTAARDRIRRQVNVRSSASGTVLKIDHRLTCTLRSYRGWHVSTKQAFLPRAHFLSRVRFGIHTAASTRGRALFCVDMDTQEVVAVMSYHIDDRPQMPVLIISIGFRADSKDNPALANRSLAGALVLKHHLHALAESVGRGGFVDLDVGDEAQQRLAIELGFRKAPRIKGFRPSGLHLRQLAPGQESGRG